MPESSTSDWHLQEWVREAGKKQADLVKDLGWHKNTAFRLWHSVQPYHREVVNEVAAWLEIEPYELLMPPAEALKIRRVRELLASEMGSAKRA